MGTVKNDENSRFCIFFILVTEVSISFLALNLSALNVTAAEVRIFINDSYKHRYGTSMAEGSVKLVLTLAQSILMWGSVVGALMVRIVLKIRSRKRSMLLIHVINVISVILMGPTAKFARSYEALIIGRFLAGVSRGLGFTIPSVVAAESSCRQTLALFQSPYAISASLSLTLGATLGHNKVLGTPELWFWVVSAPALSSMFYFCCYPWLPETPVMLIRQGQYDKAKETLRGFRVPKCDLNAELDILRHEIEADPERRPLPISTILKNPQLRLQFLSTVVIMNAHGLAGIQGILLYSDYLLTQAGVDGEIASITTIAIYLQAVVAYALFLPLEKKFGTKKLFILGASISTFSIAVFTVATAIQHTIHWFSYVALGALCVAMFGNRLGPQVTMHGLLAELTTAASRPTIAFYTGGTFWFNAAISALVLPYSLDAWNAFAYIPYVVLSLGVITFTACVVPNTYNRTTAQIQQSLRNKSSQVFRVEKQSNLSNQNEAHHANRAYVFDS